MGAPAEALVRSSRARLTRPKRALGKRRGAASVTLGAARVRGGAATDGRSPLEV